MLLHADCEAAAQLRQQAVPEYAVSRKETGVGFFLKFDVPNSLALRRFPSLRLSHVAGEHPFEAGSLDFILFINKGLVSTLEGATFGDAWPMTPDQIVLRYNEEQRRQDEYRLCVI